MKKLLTIIIIWCFATGFFLSCTRINGNTGPTCPTITNQACTILLQFPSSLPNRYCLIPDPGSDPYYVAGVTDISSSLNNGNMMCKITVVPNVSASCYTASNYIFYFTATSISRSRSINIPYGITSKLTIEYYEKCGVCADNIYGRPYWRFTKDLNGFETQLFTMLQYTNRQNCH